MQRKCQRTVVANGVGALLDTLGTAPLLSTFFSDNHIYSYCLRIADFSSIIEELGADLRTVRYCTTPCPCRSNSTADERMAKERILVVDDEPYIVESAQMYLEQAGYSVEIARDGQEALTRATHVRPALVVLDRMLPGLDGWEVCRPSRCATPDRTVAVGELLVDPGSREASAGDRVLELRPKEFDLLLCLAEHNGLVMSRDQLLDLVWGYDFPGGTRTVDAHISHLRARLAGVDLTIETYRGIGYKLVG